jgi:hypothetical protein
MRRRGLRSRRTELQADQRHNCKQVTKNHFVRGEGGAARQVGEGEQLGVAAVSHDVIRRVRVSLRLALTVIALSSLRGI